MKPKKCVTENQKRRGPNNGKNVPREDKTIQMTTESIISHQIFYQIRALVNHSLSYITGLWNNNIRSQITVLYKRGLRYENRDSGNLFTGKNIHWKSISIMTGHNSSLFQEPVQRYVIEDRNCDDLALNAILEEII